MTATISRRGLLSGVAASLALPPQLVLAETSAPSAASLARPVSPGVSAAGLLIEDAEGSIVPLSAFAGQVLVVNLWGPWCLPCRREMPSLARLAMRLEGKGASVLPLAFDWRGAIGVRRFYKEIGVDNLPVLIGEGENLQATLGVELLPTTVLLDGRANHVATVAGEATWDDDETVAWVLGLST